MIPTESSPTTPQFATFKDCLARRVISLPDFLDSEGGSEIEDFCSYLAIESWPALPSTVQKASYDTKTLIPDLETLSLDSTPISFVDTMISYGLAEDSDSALQFLRKTLENYIGESCAPPPPWSSTRTTECEMCDRAVPLTYHHLIPRSTHARALKKKWHLERMSNSVAWLCRPCHSAVHHIATNEELALKHYTMELLQREDLQRWRKYASKQRWRGT